MFVNPPFFYLVGSVVAYNFLLLSVRKIVVGNAVGGSPIKTQFRGFIAILVVGKNLPKSQLNTLLPVVLKLEVLNFTVLVVVLIVWRDEMEPFCL
jgi:hypothetical protein